MRDAGRTPWSGPLSSSSPISAVRRDCREGQLRISHPERYHPHRQSRVPDLVIVGRQALANHGQLGLDNADYRRRPFAPITIGIAFLVGGGIIFPLALLMLNAPRCLFLGSPCRLAPGS
jgi:hypothetical protein